MLLLPIPDRSVPRTVDSRTHRVPLRPVRDKETTRRRPSGETLRGHTGRVGGSGRINAAKIEVRLGKGLRRGSIFNRISRLNIGTPTCYGLVFREDGKLLKFGPSRYLKKSGINS